MDGVTGVLVHDEAGLLRAVERLLEDDVARERLGLAARERAATFGWDEAAAGVERVLASVVEPVETYSP